MPREFSGLEAVSSASEPFDAHCCHMGTTMKHSISRHL